MTPLHQSSSTCASVAPSITNTVISSPLPSQKFAGEKMTSRTIGEFAARMRSAIRPGTRASGHQETQDSHEGESPSESSDASSRR